MKKLFAAAAIGVMFLPHMLFAAESKSDKAEQKILSPEGDVIAFFSTMCLQTGGKVAEIENRLGKAKNQIDKRITTASYTKEESEDVWAVPNSVSKEPYIISVTKGGTCYVGFNSANTGKMRQEFKSFVIAQAAAAQTTPEVASHADGVAEDMLMDFYNVKLPGTENKIKFSLSVPSDTSSGQRSTMTVATE